MSLNLVINVKDQNQNGLPNIGLEIWGTTNTPEANYEKIHTTVYFTDSGGSQTIVLPIGRSEYQDTVDLKLYYLGEFIKTISGLSLEDMSRNPQNITLNTTTGNDGTVTGTIKHSITTNPIENAKIDFWIKNGAKLNSTIITSDSSGLFRFDVEDMFFTEKHSGETIEIKVYYQDNLEYTNEVSVSSFFSTIFQIDIDVTLGTTESRTIQGYILNKYGEAINNYTVVAYSVDERGDETEIGKDETGNKGDYSTSFSHTYTTPETRYPKVLIKVFDPIEKSLVATSEEVQTDSNLTTINLELDINLAFEREVYGMITQEDDNNKLDLTVVAYAINMKGDHVTLKSSDVGKSDLYSIKYNYLKSFGLNGSATFYIEVYNKNTKELLGTSDVHTNKLERTNIDYHIDINEKKCKVFGKVVDDQNQPLSNYIVKAFTMKSDLESELGETTTNSNGDYTIYYDYPLTSFNNGITLLVKLIDSSTNDILLTSPLFINAGIEEEINLALSDICFVKPLFDIVSEGLDKIAITKTSDQLTKNDLTVLAKETGLSEEDIVLVKTAEKYATESSSIDAKVFYALFKSSGNKKLSSILLQKKSTLKSTLNKAYQLGLVDNSIANNSDQLADAVLDYATSLIIENYGGLFNQLLALSSLTENRNDRTQCERTAFLKFYLKFEGNEEDFWTEAYSLWGTSKMTQIKRILYLCNITYNNSDLVDVMYTDFSTITLSQHTQDDWDSFIEQEGISIPDIFVGEDDEKRAAYAKYIKNSIEVLYPTVSLIAKIEADNDISIPNLFKFYDNNDGIDINFRTEDFDDRFSNNFYDLAEINTSEIDALKDNLKTLQRLFVITPEVNRFEAVKALYNNSLFNVHSIMKLGKASFTSLMENASIDNEDIDSVYSKAEALTFKALMLYAHYNIDTVGSPDNIVYDSDKQAVVEDILGSLDYCETSHCQSVYGPASYLTDIMQFIKKANPDTNYLDILFQRRPDLKYMYLDCHNTNTQVPFIDLVNEALENAVSNVSLNETNSQTIGEDEDIRCYPDRLNTSAYDALKLETYPWKSPFHLWNEEAKAYLNHLDINRSDILNDVPTTDTLDVSNNYYDQKVIAAEYFGIYNLQLITYDHTETTNPDFELEDIYGTNATVIELRKIRTLLERSGIDYDTLKELIQSDYINPIDMSDPDNPLQKGIDFDVDAPCDLSLAQIQFDEGEFRKLNKFWRLQQKLGWTVAELDKTLFAYGNEINEEFVTKCFHIEKIKEKHNVSIVEIIAWWSTMDKSNHFVKDGSLYNQIYLNRALENGSEDFNLPGANADLTAGKKLDNGIYEPILPNANARAHIMASLSITENELNLIISNLLGVEIKELFTIPDDNVEKETFKANHENLSKVYKISIFCKTLGISIEEYFILLDLMDKTTVYPFANPQETNEFIAELEKIKNSGWTIQDLHYLLKGTSTTSSYAIQDNEITLFLEDLRSGLSGIREKYIVSRTSISEFLDSEISVQNLNVTAAAKLKQLVIGNIQLEETELNSFISENSDTFSSFNSDANDFSGRNLGSDNNIYNTLSNIGIDNDDDQSEKHEEFNVYKNNLRTLLSLFIENGGLVEDAQNIVISWANPIHSDLDQENFINEYFSLFMDPEYAKEKLTITNSDRLKSALSRIVFISHELVKKLMEDFLYQKFADALNLELSMIKKLFTDYFYETRILKSFSSFFRRYSFITSEEKIERSTKFKLQFFYFEAIYKAALFIKHYQLSQTDIDVIHYDFSKTSWLKFTSLPARPITNVDDEYITHVKYEKWSKLENAMNLNKSIFDQELSFFEFLNKKLTDAELSQDDWFKELPILTSWDLEFGDLTTLAGKCNYSSYTNDFDDEQWLVAIEKVMQYALPLQVDPLQLISLNTQNLSSSESGSYRKLVKSTMSNNQWLEVAPKIRKPLREKQRDALVAYLISDTSYDFNDTTDLYNYYLIDTEMSSCSMTSRIKQAILSVQLFVQRSLMGLEETVVIGDTSKKEWEWAKQYRLWEANRKIYVQPENYLEPDLRRDKTELFEEVEKLLMEDDITDESVDRIYKTYLKGLSEIANLEICDISANHVVLDYYDQLKPELQSVYLSPGRHNPKSTNTHVLARTKNSPHSYYYRKLENEIWTPWEKVDIDITGDKAVITEYKGKVFIAWLEFADKALEQVYGEQQAIKKSMEIRLAWTYRNNGKWTDKKLSKEFFDTKESEKQYKSDYCLFDADGFIDQTICSIRPSTPWGESYLYFDVIMDAFYIIGTCPEPIGKANCNTFPSLNKNEITELCRFSFKSPFAEPKCNKGWDKPRLKDQETDLRNGAFIMPGKKLFDSINPTFSSTDPVRVYSNDGHYNIYKYIGGESHQLKYPSSLTNQFSDLNDYQAYYSQDPIIHQDRDRTYFIMPTMIKPVGGKSSIQSIIGNDIVDETDHIVYKNYDQKELPTKVFYDKSKSNSIVDKSTNQIQLLSNSESVETEGTEDDVTIPPKTSIGNRFFKFKFSRFFHPYADALLEEINYNGIESLFSSDKNYDYFRQKGRNRKDRFSIQPEFIPDNDNFKVNNGHLYWVSEHVKKPYPEDKISFEPNDAYGVYNWEIFFHIPILIADKLMKNKQFEEAQKWLHHIFDPYLTDVPTVGDEKILYWKTKPLVDIQDVAFVSTYNTEEEDAESHYYDDVVAWRQDPFNPHKIAFNRPIAYRKFVFMRYLDNLIAWGDHLFAQDTMESINEATQLYIMAANLLGKKPIMARKHNPDAQNYFNLSLSLDEFSNAIVDITDMIWKNGYAIDDNNETNTRSSDYVPTGVGYFIDRTYSAYYFGFPNNDKMMSYWDTVADRLFKIRHCMNIKGVERQLALFAPPIDPALIAKALAGGLSLGEALNELNAPLSYYRFKTMHQKAMEITNDVKSLGQSLLSALEKKDAESLSLLRAGHELKLHSAIKQLKTLSIEENDAQIKSLEYNKQVVEKRMNHYQNLIDTNLISKEQNQLDGIEKANSYQNTSQAINAYAGIMGLIPQFHAGFSGGPEAKADIGGQTFMGIASASAGIYNALSVSESGKSNKAGIMAGHDRRTQEWNFQVKSAEYEIGQIDKQIIAAEIRKSMAEKELANHELQTEHSEQYFEFLKDKYTNEELYSWMSGQISDVYFQSYQMAVELAKKAQKSYAFETNDNGAKFISYGNWDSMKKGLLAGEKLQADLRRMELAYMERNKRRLELTKNISLAMLNAGELMDLKETGSCYIDIPEVLFDLDYPGQYQRRIKSVSITIPAVTGPNTNISCKLSLMGSRYRKNTQLKSDKYAIENENDDRFVFVAGGMESIATSSAQNDSGMFQLNFNDERYLPFEGAGAISKWKLELPNSFRQFDYDSISDVILHINYTTFDDASLSEKAAGELTTSLNRILNEMNQSEDGLSQIISMKSQFANELHQLQNDGATSISFLQKHFPYFLNEKTIKISFIEIFTKSAGTISIGNSGPLTLVEGENGYFSVITQEYNPHIEIPEDMPLNITSSLTDEVDDIILALTFKIS